MHRCSGAFRKRRKGLSRSSWEDRRPSPSDGRRCCPPLAPPPTLGRSGAGASAKLVANATLFGTLALLGEVVALADGLGLTRDVTFDVLSATPLAGPAERRRPWIEGGEYPRRFALSLARKDAQLITDGAKAAGVDVRVLEAARTWLADAKQAGLGERDYSSVLAKIIGTD
jgi:3-hydroxyisobutyrate dehydrogenase-like beta-hydroxyacid dehydrogenase